MHEQDSRDYPVREDMRLQNAIWAGERVLWVTLGVVLLLALAGLLARGPLSRATVEDAANQAAGFSIKRRRMIPIS